MAFGHHSSLCPMSTTFERSQKGYLKMEAATVIYVSYIKSICHPWYQRGGTNSGITICHFIRIVVLPWNYNYYKNMYFIQGKGILTVKGIWCWMYVDTSIHTVNIWLHSINEDRIMLSHHRQRMVMPQRPCTTAVGLRGSIHWLTCVTHRPCESLTMNMSCQ